MARQRVKDTLLRCPICNKKLWVKGVAAHRKAKHPEIEYSEFEKMIIEAIQDGRIVPKEYGPPPSGLVSGTQKLQGSKQRNKGGVRGIVSGGRTSPK